MADINKIIRVLDLSQSSAREETLDGIVKFILYNKEDAGIKVKDIAKEISKELTIEIHAQEIDESISRLEDNNLIEKKSDGNFKLTLDEELKYKAESLKIDTNREARFTQFKINIEDIALKKNYALVENEIDELWEIFRTFIYDCYLTHGKSVIESFTKGESENDEDVNKIVKKYLKKLKNKDLEKILSKYITIYPEIVDSDILEYLTNLANKTESFYALGLSQEQFNQVYDDLKFEWIVFVDTNFLYSILSLHNHPENNAAKSLLELGFELGIKFRYITKTLDELNYKRNDFDKNLEKNLRPSQIKALIKSEKLDSFAQNYYQKLLNDKENTPHPSEVIIHSQTALKSRNLVLYNSKFEALSKNEEYLKDQESQYNTYWEMIDEVRQKRGFMAKGRKDPVQVQHDVFLREAILHLRDVRAISMNEAKYFGVTLDKNLIKFDLNQLKKRSTTIIIPTFFKPSIMLKKLLKQAPLKTKESYLRAFISTISTPALDENSRSSRVAIRSLKYFHGLGIENEKIILSCLKDELFLKNFEEKESDDIELGKFIESEINKQININTKKIEELESANQNKEERIDKYSEMKGINEAENTKLFKITSELKETINLYERELKKVTHQNKTKFRSENRTAQLTLDDAKGLVMEEKNEELKNKIVNSKLKTRKIWGFVYGLIAVILIVIVLLIFVMKDKSWNFMTGIISEINSWDDVRKNMSYIILALFIGFIEFIVVKKVVKVFNKEETQKYVDRTIKGL